VIPRLQSRPTPFHAPCLGYEPKVKVMIMTFECYKYLLVGVTCIKTIMTNEFSFCTIIITNHNKNKIKLESNHET